MPDAEKQKWSAKAVDKSAAISYDEVTESHMTDGNVEIHHMEYGLEHADRLGNCLVSSRLFLSSGCIQRIFLCGKERTS